VRDWNRPPAADTGDRPPIPICDAAVNLAYLLSVPDYYPQLLHPPHDLQLIIGCRKN
jgi:hypothetical protein